MSLSVDLAQKRHFASKAEDSTCFFFLFLSLPLPHIFQKLHLEFGFSWLTLCKVFISCNQCINYSSISFRTFKALHYMPDSHSYYVPFKVLIIVCCHFNIPSQNCICAYALFVPT